jgi:stress response protein YsnF
MVPVMLRHEELEVVREPISDGAAAPGTEVMEGVAAEVVLFAERPVVGREAVPVERVRLVKSFVQDEVTVGGEVRREEVAVDRLPPAPVSPQP